MKIATHIPVIVPSIKGKAYLCGVSVSINVAQYGETNAPVACIVETRLKGGDSTFRHTGSHFIKPVPMARTLTANDNDALTSLSTKLLLLKFGELGWANIRSWGGNDLVGELFSMANLANSEYGETVRRLPSPDNIRKGVLDPVAVEEAIANAVAALDVFCQVDGSWHSACGEPAIVNHYESQGVHRFVREFDPSLKTSNYTWTMFPVSEYAAAAAEPDSLAGWLFSNSVVDRLLPPTVLSPDVFGVDFLERETARHLLCLPDILDSELLTKGRKPRHWVSHEVMTAREELERELAGADLFTDPGPAVEATRTLFEMIRPRLEDGMMRELGWRGLAMIDRTISRWDDRPVRVNDIVRSPSGPR